MPDEINQEFDIFSYFYSRKVCVIWFLWKPLYVGQIFWVAVGLLFIECMEIIFYGWSDNSQYLNS